MEGLDKGGQGPTSGCCAIVEEDEESFQPHFVLWSLQPLTEMSTRNPPGSKGRQARKADSLTAICEPII
jgi:hypothetical protein